MIYDALADLPLTVESYRFERHESETSSGFTRVTTGIGLQGDGLVGRGEDVTYDPDAHAVFHTDGIDLPDPYSGTFRDFAHRLARVDLFSGNDPTQPIFRQHRRWGFESAALDLALKQAETTLAERLDRTYDPVRFVVSTRLAEPPTGARIDEWLDRNPDLEFKLDPTADWTEDVIERLAARDVVRILDFKGFYEGTSVDLQMDPDLYRRVIEGFPDALLEDPAINADTRRLLAGHEHRVTWDYPIQDVKAIEQLPWEPEWLNIKPSRFGAVRAVCDAIEYCRNRGIRMYGGGQFELAVGREQIQALASLFYSDAPNDIAPIGYNAPVPQASLPSSPLTPPEPTPGFRWT